MRFENKGTFITFGVGYFAVIKRVGALILLSVIGVIASAQTNTLTFTNATDQVYSNVTFVKIEAAGVLFRSEDWQYVLVKFTDMPAPIKAQFDPDRENMALIPGGAFTMGDSIGDSDIPAPDPVTANVSAFYMDKNLVRYIQWQSVYQWATNHGYGFVNVGAGVAANHPVQSVDWYDVVKWCNARSQQTGKIPVYYTDAGMTQVYQAGEVTPYVNWTANGYRLPTAAEWEKAARGGLIGQRFPWGDTISKGQANYYGTLDLSSYDLGPSGYSGPSIFTGSIPLPQGTFTSPVGSFAANGYGLYDMAGNVFEWCWDYWSESYAGGNDPHGPASSTDGERVIHGGSWSHAASFAKCAVISHSSPDNTDNTIGFRCVRSN